MDRPGRSRPTSAWPRAISAFSMRGRARFSSGQRRSLRRAHHLSHEITAALVGTLRFAHPTAGRHALAVMPALVAGIHVLLFFEATKAWMAGTSPAMTGLSLTSPERIFRPSR